MRSCTRAQRNSGGYFDVPSKQTELESIELQAAAPDLWNDQAAAQKLLQQRSRLELIINRQREFDSKIEDASVLLEFADEDAASMDELSSSEHAKHAKRERAAPRRLSRIADELCLCA